MKIICFFYLRNYYSCFELQPVRPPIVSYLYIRRNNLLIWIWKDGNNLILLIAGGWQVDFELNIARVCLPRYRIDTEIDTDYLLTKETENIYYLFIYYLLFAPRTVCFFLFLVLRVESGALMKETEDIYYLFIYYLLFTICPAHRLFLPVFGSAGGIRGSNERD